MWLRLFVFVARVRAAKLNSEFSAIRLRLNTNMQLHLMEASYCFHLGCSVCVLCLWLN